MKNIIIDTDPGIDDALAITLANSTNQLKITGLTTVFGNSSLADTTANALTLKFWLQAKFEVYPGARQPLKGSPILAEAHGQDGFGGYQLSAKKLQQANLKPRNSAQTFLAQVLKQTQSLTIACLGPTTNLALLQDLNSFTNLNLVILGGAFNVAGNKSAVAEFNVLNDPYALDFILRSGLKPVLIPIDVCQTVIFTQRDFKRIKTISQAGARLSRIAGCYLDYYQNNPRFGQKKGAIIYDLLVISYLLRPNLFELKPATVTVKTNQGQNFGQTQLVRAQSNQANCRLVTKADGDKIKQLFFQELGA